MTGLWLSPEEWDWVQQVLPIACVDVLPIQVKKRTSSEEIAEIEKVLLIWRTTPHQGTRWCLIGGRMFYGDSLGKAVEGELKRTLGLSFEVPAAAQPTYVAQYRPLPGEGFHVDTRRHAIGLTYCLEVEEEEFGSAKPQGDAIKFDWFRPDKLPQPDKFGFEQHLVVKACLERWGEQARIRNEPLDQGK
jgi:ADP-ribose pyrophosphatase YjhB (NUDIX family)